MGCADSRNTRCCYSYPQLGQRQFDRQLCDIKRKLVDHDERFFDKIDAKFEKIDAKFEEKIDDRIRQAGTPDCLFPAGKNRGSGEERFNSDQTQKSSAAFTTELFRHGL